MNNEALISEICLNLWLLLQCSWSQSFENDLHWINSDLSFFPQHFYFKEFMLSHHYNYTVHIKSCISCKSTTKEVSNYTWHKQIFLSLRHFLSCYKHERYFWDLVKNYFTAALILANPILYKIYILTFAHGWFGKCLGPVTWSTLTFWERCGDHKIKPAGFFSL